MMQAAEKTLAAGHKKGDYSDYEKVESKIKDAARKFDTLVDQAIKEANNAKMLLESNFKNEYGKYSQALANFK